MCAALALRMPAVLMEMRTSEGDDQGVEYMLADLGKRTLTLPDLTGVTRLMHCARRPGATASRMACPPARRPACMRECVTQWLPPWYPPPRMCL